ncbi:MAG: hypothetical protein GY874_19385 [Desulfobacteraceae bacterium]|nr:hypothetical protein [Desulfobacteraceae bacterium]
MHKNESVSPLPWDFFPCNRENKRLSHMHSALASATDISCTGLTATKTRKEWTDTMPKDSKINLNHSARANGSLRSVNRIVNSKETADKRSHINITAMIRSLQRTEGYTDCFRRGNVKCGELSCSWRQYCLDQSEDTV